jgi:hypothetical protein
MICVRTGVMIAPQMWVKAQLKDKVRIFCEGYAYE